MEYDANNLYYSDLSIWENLNYVDRLECVPDLYIGVFGLKVTFLSESRTVKIRLFEPFLVFLVCVRRHDTNFHNHFFEFLPVDRCFISHFGTVIIDGA